MGSWQDASELCFVVLPVKPYTTGLARGSLGGYLARMSDPPPGNTVIWRGLRRLADIQLGAEIGQGSTCG